MLFVRDVARKNLFNISHTGSSKLDNRKSKHFYSSSTLPEIKKYLKVTVGWLIGKKIVAKFSCHIVKSIWD